MADSLDEGGSVGPGGLATEVIAAALVNAAKVSGDPTIMEDITQPSKDNWMAALIEGSTTSLNLHSQPQGFADQGAGNSMEEMNMRNDEGDMARRAFEMNKERLMEQEKESNWVNKGKNDDAGEQEQEKERQKEKEKGKEVEMIPGRANQMDIDEPEGTTKARGGNSLVQDQTHDQQTSLNSDAELESGDSEEGRKQPAAQGISSLSSIRKDLTVDENDSPRSPSPPTEPKVFLSSPLRQDPLSLLFPNGRLFNGPALTESLLDVLGHIHNMSYKGDRSKIEKEIERAGRWNYVAEEWSPWLDLKEQLQDKVQEEEEGQAVKRQEEVGKAVKELNKLYEWIWSFSGVGVAVFSEWTQHRGNTDLLTHGGSFYSARETVFGSLLNLCERNSAYWRMIRTERLEEQLRTELDDRYHVLSYLGLWHMLRTIEDAEDELYKELRTRQRFFRVSHILALGRATFDKEKAAVAKLFGERLDDMKRRRALLGEEIRRAGWEHGVYMGRFPVQGCTTGQAASLAGEIADWWEEPSRDWEMDQCFAADLLKLSNIFGRGRFDEGYWSILVLALRRQGRLDAVGLMRSVASSTSEAGVKALWYALSITCYSLEGFENGLKPTDQIVPIVSESLEPARFNCAKILLPCFVMNHMIQETIQNHIGVIRSLLGDSFTLSQWAPYVAWVDDRNTGLGSWESENWGASFFQGMIEFSNQASTIEGASVALSVIDFTEDRLSTEPTSLRPYFPVGSCCSTDEFLVRKMAIKQDRQRLGLPSVSSVGSSSSSLSSTSDNPEINFDGGFDSGENIGDTGLANAASELGGDHQMEQQMDLDDRQVESNEVILFDPDSGNAEGMIESIEGGPGNVAGIGDDEMQVDQDERPGLAVALMGRSKKSESSWNHEDPSYRPDLLRQAGRYPAYFTGSNRSGGGSTPWMAPQARKMRTKLGWDQRSHMMGIMDTLAQTAMVTSVAYVFPPNDGSRHEHDSIVILSENINEQDKEMVQGILKQGERLFGILEPTIEKMKKSLRLADETGESSIPPQSKVKSGNLKSNKKSADPDSVNSEESDQDSARDELQADETVRQSRLAKFQKAKKVTKISLVVTPEQKGKRGPRKKGGEELEVIDTTTSALSAQRLKDSDMDSELTDPPAE